MQKHVRRFGAAITILALAAYSALSGGWWQADAPALPSANVGIPSRIEVFPPKVMLAGPRSRMQLVVTGHYADGSVQDLTRASQFASTAADIVVVENTVALPRQD